MNGLVDIKKALSSIRKGDIAFVDLRFVDIRGVWQHMSVPSHEFELGSINKGFGFDG